MTAAGGAWEYVEKWGAQTGAGTMFKGEISLLQVIVPVPVIGVD